MSLSPTLNFSPDYNMTGVSRKLESEFISVQDKSMCVYARVRPLLQKEEESGYNACIGVIDEETVRAVVPPNSVKYRTRNQDIIEDFKYTAAFGPEIGQFVFFEETMCNPMQDFIEGKNSLIFSYGITGSGKTYTFQGDEENPGIITLALRLFFASIEHQLSNRISFKPDKFADINYLSDEEIEQEQKLKEQLLSMQQESGNFTGCSMTAKKSFAMSLCEAFSDNFKFEERETTLPMEEMSAAQSAMQMKELCKKCADQQSGSCTVWVSFVEIYNENVYDLLQPNINLRTRLTLGEDKNGDVYIKGLREVCVSNYEEALRLLDLGRKTLKIASTKLNYQSSRSHCIYTIKVVRLLDEDNMTVRINRLAFCDLAGSERASKAQTTGLRLKEAGCINTSLLVLGRCLEQLRVNQSLKDKRLIPFRESKLTRLFSGFFLGKGGAVMIANASPCDYTFDETLNVLKFSALAKELMINDSYMSMASSSLQSISNQWAKGRPRTSDASEGNQTIDMEYTVEEIQEKDELIEKLLDLADSLRQNLEKECKEKAELEFKIRQEVCNEYSEYSDALLENQRRILEEEKSSIIDIHKKRVAALEEMYEKEIKNYKQQIEEYEAMLDESRNTSVNTEINTSAAQVFSDTSFVVVDEDHGKKQTDNNKSEVCHAETLPSESPSTLLKEYIEKNKSLQKEMDSLKEKLELTEKELQKTVLKGEMNEEVKYSELIKKLEESASIIEEYKEEINLLKESCSSYASKIKRLQEEKMILEDDVSSLSAQLASTSLELEKLRQEKEELEKMLASASEDVQKYKMQEDENIALQQKLLESTETIEKNRTEITQLLSENNDLKENISSMTDLLVTTNNSMQEIKNAKTETEEELARSLKNHQKKEADLQTKCDNLTIQLKQAVAALEEESNKVMELKKSEASSIRSQDVLNLKLQNALEDLEKEKNKIIEIKRKSVDKEDYHRLNLELQNMIQKLENSQLVIDELKKNEDNLKQKCNELELKLQASVLSLEEEKHRFNDLKKEDSLAKAKCCDLEEKLKEAILTLEEEKMKIGELVKDCAKAKAETEELQLQLDTANELLKEQKDKIQIMGKEKSTLEENIHKLKQNLQETVQTSTTEKEKTAELRKTAAALEEKCKETEKLHTEIDKLEQEKYALEGNIHKLELDLQEAVQILTSEKEKAVSLRESAALFEEKCEEVENLTAEINKLKQENSTLEEKFHEVGQNLQEAIKDVEVKKEKIDELEKEKRTLEGTVHKLEQNLEEAVHISKSEKNKADDLEKTAAVLEEKCEEIEKLKTEINKLKNDKRSFEEKFHELGQNLQEAVKDVAVKQEKIDELEKSVSAFEEKCKKVENLKAEMDVLKQENSTLEEKFHELEQNFQEAVKDVAIKKEKIDELEKSQLEARNEQHNLLLQYEEAVKTCNDYQNEITMLKEGTFHRLISVLEQCENAASLKIKEFHSNCIKHVEEVTDLRRQLNEKNCSIEDMEKALCANQLQIKELTSKFKKQLTAEKDQHSTEIEKLMQLKQMIEKENIDLKLKISQEEEARSNKRQSSSEEGNKKASRNSQKTDKENYTEAKNARKTRRVLAEKQGNVKSNIDDEKDLSSDEDFELAKETQTKKGSHTGKPPSKIPRKRKQEDEEFKVPVKRTSRRKLQEVEQENSPVRKLASAFNSRVRNLAQNVAAFSPRLTRGRKRLFNPETAAPSPFASQNRK